MKKLLTIIFFLIGMAASAQYDSTRVLQNIEAYGFSYKNVKVRDSGMFRPPIDTPRLAISDTGAIAVISRTLYIWNLNDGVLKWDAITGSSNDESAILINANGGGYELINFQTADTTKIKNLLPGTGVTFDSTATGITINSTGGNNLANADLTSTGNRSHNFIDHFLGITASSNNGYSFMFMDGSNFQLQYFDDATTSLSEIIFDNASSKPNIQIFSQDDASAFPQTGHMAAVWQDSIILRSKRNNDTTNIYLGALLPASTAVYGLGIDANNRIVTTLAGGGDTANLVILNAGTGQQTWYEVSDTLYMKMFKNTPTITWSSDTDSSLLAKVDTTHGNASAAMTWGNFYRIINDSLTFGGGGGTPGDDNGAVQFNSSGTFGGDDANFFWDNTSKYLGINTNAPVAPISILNASLGTTQVETDGISLVNNTAAAAGAQQRSPAIRFEGQGWKTNATAASRKVEGRLYLLPVQGASEPTASLAFETQVNDGTRYNSFIVGGNGLQITPNGQAGGISFAGAATANTITGTTGLTLNHSSSLATSGFNIVSSVGQAQTSGTTVFLSIRNGTATTGFNPTSGTATNTLVDVAGYINQTGGANGITRGLHVSTITLAAADWRPIQVDSGRTFLSALVMRFGTAPASGDYTVTEDDYQIELADLTSTAANRNVVLPSASVAGRILVVTNLSSDATYKWSFSSATVNDGAGAAVTTLTDQKTYTLIANGSVWRVVNVY